MFAPAPPRAPAVHTPRTAKLLAKQGHEHLFGPAGYDPTPLAEWPPAPPPARAPSAAALASLAARARLLLVAAPLALCVVAGRYGNVGRWAGKASRGDQSPVSEAALPAVVAAAAFIVCTVLAGALARAAAGARAPAELAGAFHALLGWANACAEVHRVSAKPMLHNIETMLLAVLATVDRKVPLATALAALDRAWHALQVYARRVSHGAADVRGAESAVADILRGAARVSDAARSPTSLAARTLVDLVCGLLIGVLVSVRYGDGDDASGYWVCGVFASFFIYANLLIRSLDDVFAGPDSHQFLCYVSGAAVPLSLADTLAYGEPVNFACLAGDFGRLLRAHIHDPCAAPAARAVAARRRPFFF